MSFGFFYGLRIVFNLLIVWSWVLIAIEIGYRRGRKNAGEKLKGNFSDVIPSSLLGLLALLLGFSFSMAVGRFDTRKLAMVNEANAIETSWLRAGFLPEPEAKAARALLVKYAGHRGRLPPTSLSLNDWQAHLQTGTLIQRQIWELAMQNSLRDRSPTSALFTTSVNEMIDLGTLRVFARQDHVPELVYYMITLIMIICLYALAESFGRNNFDRWALVVLSFALTLVLGLIEDIDRPTGGMIRVNPQILLDLEQNLK